MAQRLTQLQRLFYGIESTEGTEVLGTATEVFLTVGAPTYNKDQEVHERKFRNQMGFYTGVVGGHPDTGISFSCELRNRGATSNVPDLDELYKTIFGTRTLDSGSTTTNGTPSATVITVPDTSGFTVGNAVAVETATADVYEIGWIASVSTNVSLTLEQALTFTPAASKKVRSSLTFAPADSGHQSLSFQKWLDATDYESFLGCKGNVRLEVPAAGAIPMAHFDWKAWSWAHTTSGTRPAITVGDSGNPPVALSSIFKLDATKTDVRSFSVDLGQVLARKTSQNSSKGTYGIEVVDRNPTWNMSLYNADQTQFTGWNNGTEFEISHQMGNTLNNMVGIWIPKAQRTSVSDGDDNGLTTDEVEGRCNITSGADGVRLAFL